MNSFFIVALAILIIAVLVFVVFLLLNMSKKNKTQKEGEDENKVLNLDQILAKASDSKLNASDLHELILIFLNTQKFPPRAKDLSEETKKKLDFITLISLHPNTNAKEISFLNRELNKRYSAYKKEIDTYEQIGLAKRKMRE